MMSLEVIIRCENEERRLSQAIIFSTSMFGTYLNEVTVDGATFRNISMVDVDLTGSDLTTVEVLEDVILL
jgi:uncharacterized protein YjbI with pentapeptide repeats